jgi:hypothetical protein
MKIRWDARWLFVFGGLLHSGLVVVIVTAVVVGSGNLIPTAFLYIEELVFCIWACLLCSLPPNRCVIGILSVESSDVPSSSRSASKELHIVLVAGE